LALRNVRRLLSGKGVLAISTGDYGSIARRLCGRKWRLFSDPTHRFFFDEETLKRLLSEAGFEVTRLARRGKWVSLSMILHQTRLPLAGGLKLAMDRLSAFFMLIIAVGVIPSTLYAIGYTRHYKEGHASMGFALNFFIPAMMFVVLARNVLTFLIFWEVMSLTAYFLVTLEHEKAEARQHRHSAHGEDREGEAGAHDRSMRVDLFAVLMDGDLLLIVRIQM
jgi:hypothetical protein